jgi:glycosyltransferase involved in cell wall biosynthesis
MVLRVFMKHSPTVSIIMNCFNSGKYLKEAIDSVFSQSYNNWEIIFWDNMSTDDSALIANRYDKRLRYFLATKHTELGIARNLALRKARGKYIGFLDCDDLFLKDKLCSQIDFMESNDYVMTYGSAIIIDEMGRELRKRNTKLNSGDIFGQLLRHYEISMQTVMIKRSLLIAENLNFDTRLKYSPDYNLFMKIASKYPVGVMKKAIGKYRLVQNSLSSKSLSIAGQEMKFTLDLIFESSESLRNKYPDEFQVSYDKCHYYDAIAHLVNKDREKACMELYPIIRTRYVYLILYLLIRFFIPIRIILKVLGR